MKKKVFTLLTIFLSAFFFCGINFVNADTITLNNYYSHFDMDLPLYLSNYEYYNTQISYLNFTHYILYYRGDTLFNLYSLDNALNSYSWTTDNNFNVLRIQGTFSPGYMINKSQPTTVRVLGGLSEIYLTNGYTFSDSTLSFSTFTYAGRTFDTIVLPSFTSSYYSCDIPSITIHSGDTVPSYYDIYYSHCVAPPDETPLLTSFYSLCIDKIGLVAEEFMTNYIYLAIITIFLFITILLIIKRRLF